MRNIGRAFVAVSVVSAVAASAASASGPEFSPGTLNTLTGVTGLAVLGTAATSPVDCASSTTTGEISGAKKVGNVMITFSGCHSSEKSGCSVKSAHGGTGEILTETLDGELGSVKTTEAESGVGLLLLPTSGTTFVLLEGSCLLSSPSPVDGTIAGQVTPTTNEGKAGQLIFEGSKGNQSIKAINILGTTVEPQLKALGLLAASEETTGALEFANAVEVLEAKGPRILVAPGEKKFKELSVELAETEEETFTYKNDGPGNWKPGILVLVTTARPPGGAGSLVAKGGTCAGAIIAEGKTCTEKVEFKPKEKGNYEAKLVLDFAPTVRITGVGKK